MGDDEQRIGPLNDGTGPLEDPGSPDARRPHGGVRDTAHPDFMQTSHRYLPTPEDDLGNEARSLVEDDLSSRRR